MIKASPAELFSIRPATSQDGARIRARVFSVLAEFGLPPDPGGMEADLKEKKL